MKTILVPTDFSSVADNAINYAAEIGKLTKSKIILFHAFHVPYMAGEMQVVMPSIAELESSCLEGLEKIQQRLNWHYGKNLAVECVCRFGFALDEINTYAEEHNADLIVMGMQGAGYLAEKLIGSLTTSLMQKAKRPVLAIDKDVKYRSIKKIVLACDYTETDNGKVLEPLKEFAELFKSHVYVLNVVGKPAPVPSYKEAVSDFVQLDHALEELDHTFHYLQNDEVVEGINAFVSERKMDMVVMIPHKHTILKNIFSETNTKKMAFHSKVPLLALH